MSTEIRAQNSIALTSVKAIKDATDESQALLESMRVSAENAGTTLTGIYQDAEDAKTNAGIAQDSAETALASLSQVQGVLDVVNWVAEHGTYTKTTDTAINPNKTYYTVVGTAVASPTDEAISTYYELVSGAYVKTTDTAVVSGKTYYTVTGTPVSSPAVADIGTYYELAIDEAMSNYIQAHLALTDEGLYVMADNSEWKVQIASDGVYILDPSNLPANQMTGTGNVVGYEDEAHMVVSATGQFLEDSRDNRLFAIVTEEKTPTPTTGGTFTFTADGSKTDFVLSFDVIIILLRVTVNGIEQARGVDYELVGNNIIRFTNAPAQGSSVAVRYVDESAYDNLYYTLGIRDANYACGIGSVVEGLACYATGDCSHAEGKGSLAEGNQAHAEGASRAYAERSHAEGFSWVYGIAGHGEGGYYNTQYMPAIASGQSAHAEGWDTNAYGDLTHVQNEGTEAGYKAQTAIGSYNDNQEGNAFEIGNGTSTTARSNAFTVDWDGNVVASGNVGAVDVTASGNATADNFLIDLSDYQTTGSVDKELYDAIVALGWDSDVLVS